MDRNSVSTISCLGPLYSKTYAFDGVGARACLEDDGRVVLGAVLVDLAAALRGDFGRVVDDVLDGAGWVCTESICE